MGTLKTPRDLIDWNGRIETRKGSRVVVSYVAMEGEKRILGSYYNSDLGYIPCSWNIFGEYRPNLKSSLDIVNVKNDEAA